MKKQELRSNILLMITAAIWGFAFVAQRMSTKYVGAFTFNGIRFALGAISLIPLLLYFSKKSREEHSENYNFSAIPGGMISGTILFLAASFQQIGLADTTAGKAAFITGLYIILVPGLGIFLKNRINRSVLFGAILAITGLYLISVTDSFSISKGDLIELIGAFFWACHILFIDHFTKKVNPIKLSFIQFITCSFLSLTVALFFEKIILPALIEAILPILYGGFCSVGIAYTLQVVAQKHAKASHAAIILSMESVFAALGGLLFLGEIMGVRGYTGCALMFAGMLISQLQSSGIKSNQNLN